MGFDLSGIKKYLGRGLVLIAVAVIILGLSQRAEAGYTLIDSPNWEIVIDDSGYSDNLVDNRPGFEGRDYLSGEWGGAVGYTVGGSPATTPKWLTPLFEGPTWTTNSNFGLISATAAIGTNLDGFNIYQSTIGNADLEIEVTSQVVDTGTGMAIGTDPASSGGAGSSLNSDQYVFKQTYGITNISGEDITDLKFYQLLVGDNATSSLYDDRDYGGTLGSYQFDTTVNGESYDWNNATGEWYVHDDALTLHTDTAPTGYESGEYIDSGDMTKPAAGVHISVEAGSLNGVDDFTLVDPDSRAGGAQEHTLANLAPGATEIHDVLISINSVDDILPWRPGDSFLDPIMPDEMTLEGDVWLFWFGAPDGEMTFIDPDIAIGYDYYHGDPFNLDFDPLDDDPYIPYNPDQNFQSVLLPDLGDGFYDLYLFDTATDSWVFEAILKAGEEYNFGAGGVDRFRILGIEEYLGIYPTDPTAFVTGLTLVTPGTIAVTMQAITNPVPEPSTYLLLGSGLAGLIVWRKRRNKG
ncbi:hypothetical protein MNBD_DELTA02-509 [hydrothermal vent metagenome]|uniref:Ice-binding protein C-terminal domain-containing protein n=1 Tax=hydrothermal vent metagenome TaxID=652676 RepID=A0A3B0V0N6_9ZZZZ